MKPPPLPDLPDAKKDTVVPASPGLLLRLGMPADLHGAIRSSLFVAAGCQLLALVLIWFAPGPAGTLELPADWRAEHAMARFLSAIAFCAGAALWPRHRLPQVALFLSTSLLVVGFVSLVGSRRLEVSGITVIELVGFLQFGIVPVLVGLTAMLLRPGRHEARTFTVVCGVLFALFLAGMATSSAPRVSQDVRNVAMLVVWALVGIWCLAAALAGLLGPRAARSLPRLLALGPWALGVLPVALLLAEGTRRANDAVELVLFALWLLVLQGALYAIYLAFGLGTLWLLIRLRPVR